MARNPGNLGHRYVMTTLLHLEAQGKNVLHAVSCGHNYETPWDSEVQAQRTVELMKDRIGKRQRCLECEP
jgi:hypothetical protein